MQRLRPANLLRFGVVLASFAGPLGCQPAETKYDVFMKGLQVEGEAERGACSLVYEPGSYAAVLSGDQVQHCLTGTEEALRHYERAATMGYADVEFTRVYERAKERRARLEDMLHMVRKMERERASPSR